MPTDRDVDDLGDLEARIAMREEEGQELRSAMETARRDFVQAAADALVSRYEATTLRLVKASLQKTKEQARDGTLGQLKAALQDLKHSARVEAEKVLSSEALWQSVCTSPVRPGESSPLLDAPLQRIAGRLVALLVQHGYSQHGHVLSEDRPFPWSDAMNKALSRYLEVWQQVRQTDEAIARDRREKDEVEAQSLWDNA